MKISRRVLTYSLLAGLVFTSIACHVERGEERIEENLPTPTSLPEPLRSPVAVEIPPVTDAVVADARSYAEDIGVDLDEAVRRLGLQGAIGKLGAAVSENEQATYGGRWIQHEPEFRAVFAFTRDGEETIRPYVHGTILADMVEVRRVEATLAELKAAQREAHEILKGLGVLASSGIDVKRNIVELYLPEDEKEKLDTGLRDSGLELPDRVEIVIAPLPEPA